MPPVHSKSARSEADKSRAPSKRLRSKTLVLVKETPELTSGSKHWTLDFLLSLPSKECEMCEQNTHQMDRDGGEGAGYLCWSKWNYNHKKQKVPAGRECYNCFDIRRRFYNNLDLDTLKDAMTKTEEESATFFELRRDKVSGENRLRSRTLKALTHDVVDGKEGFDEAYEEGTFMPVRDFCKAHNIEDETLLTDMDAFKLFVAQNFGFEVGEGETGAMGVFVTNQAEGTYKFKRGLRKSQRMERKEEYENEAAAKDRLAQLQENEGAGLMEVPESDEAEDGEKDVLPVPLTADNVAKTVGKLIAGPVGLDLSPTASGISGHSEARKFRRDHQTGFFRANHLGAASATTTTEQLVANLTLTKARINSAASSYTAVSEAKSWAAKSPEQDDGTSTTAETKPTPGKSKKKGQQKQHTAGDIIQQGEAFLEESKAQCSPEALWDRRIRNRDFETLLVKLACRAPKLANILCNPQAASLAEDMFTLSTQLEEMKVFFADVRSNPEKFVESIEEKDLHIFGRLKINLKGNVLVQSGFALIQKNDVDPLVVAARLCRYGTPSSLNVTALGSLTDPEVLKVALHVQQSIVSAWMDKVAKKITSDEFTKLMTKLRQAGMLPSADLISKVGSLEADTCLKDHGWAKEHCIDLLVLEFLAGVVADRKAPMLRESRRTAEAIKASKDHMSSRMRTYIRVAGLGSANNLKMSWDLMVSKSEVVGSSAQRMADVTAMLTSFLAKCTVAKGFTSQEERADKYYDIMCQLQEDNSLSLAIQDLLINVRDGYGYVEKVTGGCNSCSRQDDVDEQQQLSDDETLLLMLQEAVCQGLIEVLQSFGFFANYGASLVCGDASAEQLDEYISAFQWLRTVVNAIAKFPIGASKEYLCSEAIARTDTILAAGALRVDLAKKQKQPEAILVAWAGVWKLFMKTSAAAPALKEDDPLVFLQQYCQQATVFDYEKPIVDYISQLASSENFTDMTPSVMTALDEYQHALPGQVAVIYESVKACRAVLQAAEQIKEGRSVGLLQCSVVLQKGAKIVDPIKNVSDKIVAMDAVKAEFSARLKETLANCNMEKAVAFEEKYGNVLPAVKDWTFSEVTWLTSGVADSERNAEIKVVEHFVLATPTTMRVIQELHNSMEHLTWITPDERNQLAAAQSMLEKHGLLATKVALIIGAMVLTNAVLCGTGLEATKAYVFSKLRLPQASLPRMLKDKLSGGGNKGSEVATTEIRSVSAVEETPPPKKVETASCETTEPKPKVRRLTCRNK